MGLAEDIDVAVAHLPGGIILAAKGRSDCIAVVLTPEHQADRFLSPSEFQWESQASTKVDSLKGRRITGHMQERRKLHLFVQYDSHQSFAYLGEVTYVSHEGETPMRVRFEMKRPLPENLAKVWM